MARTSEAQVRDVLLGAYDDVTHSLAPFIDAANSIVNKVATCASSKGDPQSAADLELLERWLAAHGYAMSNRPMDSTRTLSAGATFSGKTGMHLEATTYGQMALSLDHSGCLAAIASGARRSASVGWLGKDRDDQLTYEERN